MATHLVTGYAGMEHVAAADDGTLHAGVVGSGKYVFNSGSNFACEVVNNNLITIRDGDLMNQGRHIKIANSDYEELTIDNGLAGIQRYDLIVCRYTKNADTNIESASMIVVKGTSSESPTDPTVKSGDIFGGELVDDFPLYRVRLNGLEIEGVDCLFEPIHTLTDTVPGTLLNQAAKSWVEPDDEYTYIYDIGAPDTSKYPLSEYYGASTYYVDVLTGKVYQVETVFEINGGQYQEWKHIKTLTSVQDELNKFFIKKSFVKELTVDANSPMSVTLKDNITIPDGYTLVNVTPYISGIGCTINSIVKVQGAGDLFIWDVLNISVVNTSNDNYTWHIKVDCLFIKNEFCTTTSN